MMIILEHMVYQTIDISKVKTKVLNIYPVIQCKPTPLYIHTYIYILKADFFTLMSDYTWNCICLESSSVCGVEFPFQKATFSFFSLAHDLKTSQASHTNAERPT